ncbi:P-II family nitrogen regulator [Petrachloros mirabilis]
MKMLMIVARESMLEEFEKLFRENAITAYTIHNKVAGKGKTGKVYQTLLNPETNVVINVVLPSQQMVDKAVSALKSLHSARVEGSHGRPIPFKVFSFPCEELI